MSVPSITLKDYLKHIYSWKESYFYAQGAATLGLQYKSFEAALEPSRETKVSFFTRWRKKLPLSKLLSEVEKVMINPQMLAERNDFSSLTDEQVSRMSEKDRNQIELLKKLMQASGQKYQTQLEYLTEPFRSKEAKLDSLLNGGVSMSASLTEFPYGEWMKLDSFNCSLKSKPTPYICLIDSEERKWYFDMQVMMQTEDIYIEGEALTKQLAHSLTPSGYQSYTVPKEESFTSDIRKKQLRLMSSQINAKDIGLEHERELLQIEVDFFSYIKEDQTLIFSLIMSEDVQETQKILKAFISAVYTNINVTPTVNEVNAALKVLEDTWKFYLSIIEAEKVAKDFN